MKYLTLLIKPASGNCQLRCKYCFYFDELKYRAEANHGIMQSGTRSALIDKTLGTFDEPAEITYMFQGGEPTLAGLDWFREFVREVNEKKKRIHKIHYGLQTNGYGIDEKWADFFKANHFLIGVSLDGYRTNHNAYRLSAAGKDTFDQILHNIQILKEKKVEFNILTVLTSRLSKHPDAFYTFLQKQDFRYIQLIPCLAAFNTEDDPYALKPQQYADFYIRLFDLWFDEYVHGIYRSIGLFDSLVGMFFGRPPGQCGMLGWCSYQYVVEADGSVYPCDFYCTDGFKMGSFIEDTFENLTENEVRSTFLHEKRNSTPLCETCRYRQMCGGGCKRQNSCMFNEHFCGHQKLLEHIEPYMRRLQR